MENSNTKNIRHLYDLAHAVPEIPALGSIYSKKFQHTLEAKNLSLPNQINHDLKFCNSCKTLLIAGINLTMRVKYSKSKSKDKKVGITKKSESRKRKLQYKCLSCHQVSNFDILEPSGNPYQNDKGDVSQINREFNEVADKSKPVFVATWDKNKNSNTKPLAKKADKAKNTAKHRSKERKKNTLASLLSSKKESDDHEKKKSSLLSLSEFMKN